MSAPRRGGDSAENGMTLVELLVTMAIMLVVGGILLAFLEQTTSLVQRAGNDVQAENDARLALRTMTQDIRAARPSTIGFTGPVSSACPSVPSPGTCLSFTINRGTTANPNCKTTVTYGLLVSSVQQTRSDANCASNSSLSRALIGNVANGTTSLFAYYDAQGNLLSSGQAAAHSIGITLLVSYQGGSSPLTFTSTLSLRNAR
jgi:prepilin-type N-terminal cleavage/methylation domain-containing protein